MALTCYHIAFVLGLKTWNTQSCTSTTRANFGKLNCPHEWLLCIVSCSQARAVAGFWPFLAAPLALVMVLLLNLGCCRYIFKNLMRDWSQEGAPERTQSYGRICQEAQRQLAGRDAENPPKVLVPGILQTKQCWYSVLAPS